MAIFAVVARPGYFGDNQSPVFSRHRALAAAEAACKKHEYYDATGAKKSPACIVRLERRRKFLWGDELARMEILG